MSRRFREDENELPYLVWETRDEKPRNRTERFHLAEINIENKPINEFSSVVDGLLFSNQKINLLNSIEVKPKNCTFSIKRNDDDFIITFYIKNDYLTSEIIVHYDLNSCQIQRPNYFASYDGLKSMQWFKNAVKQIEQEKGYKFDFCTEGYDALYKSGKLLINDDFDVIVMFDDDESNDQYGYKVDFENKKLNLYHVYPFHESFELFYL